MKGRTNSSSLLQLTWPIFIEMLLFMVMGNVDTLMLSAYSDESVAAVGVSNQIMFFVMVLFGFVSMGTGVLIAQYRGAQDELRAREIAVVSLGANLLFGLLVAGLLFIFTESLLKMMDIPIELLDIAMNYTHIVGGFIFFQAVLVTQSAILRSNGFTRDTMVVTLIMNVLNVVGNYLFLFGPFGIPVLGETGVAISTAFSRFVALIIIVFIMHKRLGNVYRISLSTSKLKKHLLDLLKIGVPSAGENLSYSGSQMVITMFISALGTMALTTRVYAQNLSMFIFLFSMAVSQGTMILVGQLVGAGKAEEAYTRCLKSLRISIAVSFVMSVVFFFFSEPLLRIFTDNESIIKTGQTILALTMLLEPGRAFNLVVISSLRAAGDVKFPVYIGIASMWGISVPAAYLLGITFDLGLAGIWIAFALDEWVRGILMLLRWRSKVWVSKALVTVKKDEVEPASGL